MKRLFVILSILISSVAQAQTINDHYNYIREQKPGGSFSSTKPYAYSVIESTTNTLVMYFLNDDLICNQIVIVPPDATTRQLWVESSNQKWVVISSTRWKFYKDDGTILVMFMDYVDEVGSVFVIREEKVQN